jgi:hypothetical protein
VVVAVGDGERRKDGGQEAEHGEHARGHLLPGGCRSCKLCGVRQRLARHAFLCSPGRIDAGSGRGSLGSI